VAGDAERDVRQAERVLHEPVAQAVQAVRVRHAAELGKRTHQRLVTIYSDEQNAAKRWLQQQREPVRLRRVQHGLEQHAQQCQFRQRHLVSEQEPAPGDAWQEHFRLQEGARRQEDEQLVEHAQFELV